MSVPDSVPGEYYCPVCGYTFALRLMDSRMGNLQADTTAIDRVCPNDGELMACMTWRVKCVELERTAKSYLEQIARLEGSLSLLRESRNAVVEREQQARAELQRLWDSNIPL